MSNQRRPRILPLIFPRMPVYKNVPDYLHSKNNLKTQSKECQWDKPGHDPVFHYHAAQRIFQDTSEKLKEKREWASHEHKKLKDQWRDLHEKELKLKDTFTKLSSFIRSNQDKRLRAEQHCQEDHVLGLKRMQDIEELRKKYDQLLKTKNEMEANIGALHMYEKYLDKIVSASDDFINADDPISRYEALVNTRNLLGKRQDDNLCELEMARVKTAKMIEENRFKILGLNNTVAELNSRYNTAFREALHWEGIVLSIRKHSYEKYQELTEVRQSCRNLYLMMCRRKSETPKIAEDDYEKQMIYIKKTMQELDTVTGLVVREGSSKERQGKRVGIKGLEDK